jgi:hypothetical protein
VSFILCNLCPDTNYRYKKPAALISIFMPLECYCSFGVDFLVRFLLFWGYFNVSQRIMPGVTAAGVLVGG